MVMTCPPLFAAVEAFRSAGSRVVLMTPQGRRLNQAIAASYVAAPHIIILCGHYEGIDERVRIALKPEEISVGDYVLTGGELPALVIIDAATRLIPGVLGAPESVVEESFSEPLLEYPHYTRPGEVRGLTVPEVLLSGHHEEIRLWRRKEALRMTYERRPDLLKDRRLTVEDQQLLDDIIREGVRGTPVPCGEEG